MIKPDRRQVMGAATAAFALVAGLTFLGKPRAPLMIVVDAEARPGIIEPNQYRTLLDKPLPEYVAWSKSERRPGQSRLDHLRETLQAAAPGRSRLARAIMSLFGQIPGQSPEATFDRQSTVEEAQKSSIWKDDTRDRLGSPIPMPDPASAARIHVARIPPRAVKGKDVGHVEPDPNREAVWIRSIEIKPSPQPDNNPRPRSNRALILNSGDYLIGWLFVITQCAPNGCKLAGAGEANCLKPETLTDHVLGMTHLIIPRAWLYGRPGEDETIDRSAIPENGGLALLVGADHDHVALRVSLQPAREEKPADTRTADDLDGDRPLWTTQSSIAMQDERLHEVLARINRARDINEGDFVLILPTALDVHLGKGDYLIVGLDGVPPPLRSHYMAPGDPPAQGRKPAALISAAVDE